MENHPSPQPVTAEAAPSAQPDSFAPIEPPNMAALSETYGSSTFFRRWVAHVIDHILLACFLLGMSSFADQSGGTWAVFLILALLIGIPCYYVLLEGLTGFTVGKLALQIKAVDAEGRPPGLGKSFIRSLLRFVDTNPLLVGGLPAGISVLVTKRKQRLGDLAANTYVVKLKDLPHASKKSTARFTVIFSIAALLCLIFGMYGVVSLAKSTPKERVFTSKDKLVQLTATSGWSKDNSLHEEANLVISNRFADKYVLVISEAKDDLGDSLTLEEYAEIVETNFDDELVNSSIGKFHPAVVDHNPAIRFTVSGEVDDVDVTYIMTVIETPTHFHQVMAWTEARKFDSLEEELLDITSSFRERADTAGEL